MQAVLVWLVFFLICLGLGYATLNRYDPRIPNPDSTKYYTLVTEGSQAVPSHMRFRVLVPLLARPFYHIAQGRVGSWNPVFFGLLVANSLLTASTAFLLVRIASALLGNYSLALLGATLYLLNFANPNLRLAGLIDSGEGFFLLAIVGTLLSGRWYLLPIWGVAGAMAKESFVPFSIVLAATWWVASCIRGGAKPKLAGWVAGMSVFALAAVTLLQWRIAGDLTWPWQFAASLNSHSNYAANLVASLADRNFWYVFVWLLPLGIWRLKRLPPEWVWSSCATVLCAFVLNAYYSGQPGTVGRAMFSIAGPLLSLSTAMLLAGDGEGQTLLKSRSATAR